MNGNGSSENDPCGGRSGSRGEPGHGARIEPQALVDIHVHFHGGFREVRFFRSALANFISAAEELEIAGPWTGIMVLTDPVGSDAFQRFSARASKSHRGPIVFESTEEEVSFSIRDEDATGVGAGAQNGTDERGIRLAMVAGRQVRTEEALEVLAFPLLEPFPDGLPTGEAISRAQGMGAVVVLPWGFGKWSGGRGTLLAGILDARKPGGFLLADTGHRPRFAPTPRILRRGEAASVPVLTGSDPLPLPGEDRRPGSCCFPLPPGDWERTPGLTLKGALERLSSSPPRFEKPPGLIRFAFGQVAMQIRKQKRRRRP